MTGTFKFDTKSRTFVFRDENGNSVSWNTNSDLWEVWSKGGKRETDCDSLVESLTYLESLPVTRRNTV